MSEDLIKRSDAIEAAGDQSYIAYEIRKKIRMIPSANTPYKVLAHIDLDPDEVVERMKNLQIRVNPIEANSKEGKWFKDDEGTFICSCCGSGYKDQPTCMGRPLFEYCPICGAKMEGVDE